MSGSTPLIRVESLAMSYRQDERWMRVLESVSFDIAPGETFGLAGESGCGKSTVVHRILGYAHPNSHLDGGRIMFKGADILAMGHAALGRLRGNRISLVPQNPTTALSPGMRAGEQIVEVLLAHGASPDRAAAQARVATLLELVGLPVSAGIARRYPHQLSGGQQQRVIIAMALACSPDLLVLDEPTTGLDVTTQKQILDLLRDLRARVGMAMLYVTHDLGVLAEIADRVGIMYAGHMVEIAPAATLFAHPLHPYTRGLIASRPQLDPEGRQPQQALRGLLRRRDLPPGCPFAPRCSHAEGSCTTNLQRLELVSPGHAVACQRWRTIAAPALVADAAATATMVPLPSDPLLSLDDISLGYGSHGGWQRLRTPPLTVVRALSLWVDPGETLALVGESGSGKSTIARAISGLIEPLAGAMRFKGEALPGSVRTRPTMLRREIQYVFQNPDASLNPRMSVGGILARPLQVYYGADAASARRRVAQVLDDVRLDAGYAARYPDELSGGERQRVAIARALVADPVLMLCDEVLSALDVSVQSSIIELLQRLRREHHLAMLFISHDLAVVRALAGRVGVLFRGTLVELGPTEEVFAPPFHPYTYSLLLAVPGVGIAAPPARAAVPAAVGAVERGCVFAGRCPWQVGPICETTTPPWQAVGGSLRIRCHIPPADLAARADWGRRAQGRTAIAGDFDIQVAARMANGRPSNGATQ
jgi:peptide/nickel transport system ATP-binding protein